MDQRLRSRILREEAHFCTHINRPIREDPDSSKSHATDIKIRIMIGGSRKFGALHQFPDLSPSLSSRDMLYDFVYLVLTIVHVMTNKSLHNHDFLAPITVKDTEVSCYGNATFGDTNDHWMIEKITDLTADVSPRIRSLSTRFKLRHVNNGCYLKAAGLTLPEWGFKQVEVTCEKPDLDNQDSSYLLWNIENHRNDLLPRAKPGLYKRSFLQDFIDINIGMWTSNNSLKPDPDKEPDLLTSRPHHWPFMLRTLRMCGWGNSEIKFLLVGNPVIWFSSTAALVVMVATFLTYVIRQRRGLSDFANPGNRFLI